MYHYGTSSISHDMTTASFTTPAEYLYHDYAKVPTEDDQAVYDQAVYDQTVFNTADEGGDGGRGVVDAELHTQIIEELLHTRTQLIEKDLLVRSLQGRIDAQRDLVNMLQREILMNAVAASRPFARHEYQHDGICITETDTTAVTDNADADNEGGACGNGKDEGSGLHQDFMGYMPTEHVTSTRDADTDAGISSVILAAVRGNVTAIKQWLSMNRGSRNNMEKDAINTALLRACQYKNRLAALELIDSGGANVHVEHESPLLWACANSDHALARDLLSRGADRAALDWCAVRIAAGKHDMAMLQTLYAA